MRAADCRTGRVADRRCAAAPARLRVACDNLRPTTRFPRPRMACCRAKASFFDFFNQHAELAVTAARELVGAVRRPVELEARSRASTSTKSRRTRSRTRRCSCCTRRSSRRSTATRSTASSPHGRHPRPDGGRRRVPVPLRRAAHRRPRRRSSPTICVACTRQGQGGGGDAESMKNADAILEHLRRHRPAGKRGRPRVPLGARQAVPRGARRARDHQAEGGLPAARVDHRQAARTSPT